MTFEALRQRSEIFEEDLIAYVPLSFNGSVAVRHAELPEEAAGEEVSGNFFSGLSARIEAGRGFTLDDEKSHAPVVVLSYDYWTRSFARDPDILGKTVHIKGVPFTVVGVTARGFKGIQPAVATDFWIPLQKRAELNAWSLPDDSLYGTQRWWSLRDGWLAYVRGCADARTARAVRDLCRGGQADDRRRRILKNGNRCSTSRRHGALADTTRNIARR